MTISRRTLLKSVVAAMIPAAVCGTPTTMLATDGPVAFPLHYPGQKIYIRQILQVYENAKVDEDFRTHIYRVVVATTDKRHPGKTAKVLQTPLELGGYSYKGLRLVRRDVHLQDGEATIFDHFSEVL